MMSTTTDRPQKHSCMECRKPFASSRELMEHATIEHIDIMGRGRTRSRTWSCWRCCTEMWPEEKQCVECGFVHPGSAQDRPLPEEAS